MTTAGASAAGGSEAAVVARQVGRRLREPWRVVARCPHGRPRVVASPSRLSDGTPFPTTFWLTCPTLVSEVGRAESAGGVGAWTLRLTADAGLAARMRDADGRYRTMRAEESGGLDACAGVGVAGKRDALMVKCLHAHVAAWLAGTGDPVGAEVAAAIPDACGEDTCAGYGAGEE